MKRLYCYIIILLWAVPAFAQQPEDNLEGALEAQAEQTDKVTEADALWQQLEAFEEQPLNLNAATPSDLKAFFFLNSLQIQSFINYRKIIGNLISIYELQAVPFWNVKTIYKILPYVTVSNAQSKAKQFKLKHLFKEGSWHFLTRYKRYFERKRGYKPMDSVGNTHYLGPPYALYLRMQYRVQQHLNFGLTAEKDAGEPFKGGGEHGFDFYSFHFFIENNKVFNALAIGDYKINFGQGLISRQGLSFGKTAMVMHTDHSQSAIRPHTSAMEYDFYRGVAVNFGKKHLTTTLFLSRKPEDANLIAADTLHNYFHSLQSSGYHRSQSELEDKNSVKLLSTGGNVRYDFGKGHIAFNMVYHHFSDPMKKSGQAYQQFNPAGKDLMNSSIDYALFLNKLYFFGETAVDKNGAIATLNGLLMSADRHVDISLLYRHYASQYTSLYAQAFGESSRPQNESGFYAGLVLRPVSGLKIDAYADFFRSPWLRYRVDMPSSGKGYLVEADYTPSKKFKAYVRYRYKQKPLNVLKDDPMAKVVNTNKQNIRLYAQWQCSDYFRVRSQGELVSFRKVEGTQYGYMFYQDFHWKPNSGWSSSCRAGYFHTDNYDTRLYTFENNVRYAYSIPSFYGEGLRAYINFRINIGRKVSLWSKIARTWYFDRNTVGSGWDEIEGNKRTQLIVECIWEP